MSFEVFEKKYNEYSALSNQIELDELRVKQEKQEVEMARINHEKELLETEKRVAAETAERLRLEDEQRKSEEQEELKKVQKRVDYIKFLESHGWTKDTASEFKTEETAEGYTLYKKLGTFKK